MLRWQDPAMVRGSLVPHQQGKKPTPLFQQAGTTAAALEQNWSS